MNVLTITDDGKLCVNDFSPLTANYVVLYTLYMKPEGMRILELVQMVRRTHDQFRFIDNKVVVRAIDQLMKLQYVECHYA